MTPLPNKPHVAQPPPPLLPPLADAISRIVRRRGPNPFKRVMLAGASGQPITFAAERALRIRDNEVVYQSTGLPLRHVDRQPRTGEYRRAIGGKLIFSSGDADARLIIKTRYP
jgi:hypothetical protein